MNMFLDKKRQIILGLDDGWIFSFNPTPSYDLFSHINMKVRLSRLGIFKYLLAYVSDSRHIVTIQLYMEPTICNDINGL